MKEINVRIQGRHVQVLREHFFKKTKVERGAVMLFGAHRANTPDDKVGHFRFTSHSLDLLNEQDLLSNSPTHVTWSNERLFPALKAAKKSHLTVAIVHSHISTAAYFSSVDDDGEAGFCELIRHRNGPTSTLLSIVMDANGAIRAREWQSPIYQIPVDKISVIGDTLEFHFTKDLPTTNPIFERQALAFGPALASTLAQLTIAVVGCGGTGSAVASLLARLGVGNLILIDPDTVEITNLNRLHGATMQDAISHANKVDAVSRHINSMGLGTKIRSLKSYVSDPRAWDLLRCSDIIFGCTDDNSGRLLINRFAYFYVVPVIDVGLGIELSRATPPRIEALDGRVTVLQPGATCLLCRGVIRQDLARAEALKRADPLEYSRQKDEAYVVGEGNPNPSVVTFTTEVATMAVNELLQRIVGYRGRGGSTAQRTRLFHKMHDLRPGEQPRPDCPVCGNDYYWGRADMTPFLDQTW